MAELETIQTEPEPLAGPAGDTIFILGNGPSLSRISLQELSDFATIGMNSAYRFWRRIDWRPTYYACLDDVVGLSHKEAISDLITEGHIKKFLLRTSLVKALGAIGSRPNVVNFDLESARSQILSPIPITTGSHAMLWAAHLDYKRIILLGIDSKYKEVVAGAVKCGGIELEIVEKSENPNYFFDDYQQPGDRYNLPNPRPGIHLRAWKEASAVLKRDAPNIQVFQTNAESAVQFFPLINFEDFMIGRAEPRPAQIDVMPAHPSLSARERTSAARLAAFVRCYGLAAAATAAIVSLFLVLAPRVIPGASAPILAAYIALGLSFISIVLLLYTRKTLIAHLHELDRRIYGQNERLQDLESKYPRSPNA